MNLSWRNMLYQLSNVMLIERSINLRARSIWPKIPVWISEIFVCWMERYFPPGRTDLVLFPLEHISHQELLEKMLRDRDEVAVLSAVLSCFVWRSLINSSLIFMRETYELFSRKSKQTGRTDPQEIPAERPVHNFPGNQILTFSFSIKNRLEPWQIISHPV